jgi:hypothetical protein
MACVPASRPAPEQVPAGDKPKRSMFDGLKLSAGPASPAPAKAAERGQDRSYVQAVERTAARAAQAIIQAQERGAPVLEHQKVALETARGTLEQIRPGASRDMIAAIERDPGLIGEAAAGRSGPMLTAINTEARVRTDPVLRADRFVERWQGCARSATSFTVPATWRAARRPGRRLPVWRKALSAIRRWNRSCAGAPASWGWRSARTAATTSDAAILGVNWRWS